MDVAFQELLARAYCRRGFLLTRPQVISVEMAQADGGIQLVINEQGDRRRVELMLPHPLGVDYGIQAA